MSVVFLRGAGSREATLLSNRFIDEYMPKANGDFVKIYIYLLRSLSEGETELCTSRIADLFLLTDGDVLRALRYWEGQGLLSLTFESDGQLSGIRFGPDSENAPLTTVVNPEPEKPAVVTPISVGRQAMLSQDRVNELKKNEDATSLLFIAEKYLGKTLSYSETEKLLYFYDQMHMSVDLIDHLIQMCVETGHPSIHYIE
ncbi:MAG: DnaD domain protein, partial [Blautia sp.]|nr:DnaD domain protein [Blautia sp.]